MVFSVTLRFPRTPPHVYLQGWRGSWSVSLGKRLLRLHGSPRHPPSLVKEQFEASSLSPQNPGALSIPLKIHSASITVASSANLLFSALIHSRSLARSLERRSIRDNCSVYSLTKAPITLRATTNRVFTDPTT